MVKLPNVFFYINLIFNYSVLISGLNYNTQYKVIVEAYNGVSDQVNEDNSASVIFTTQDISKLKDKDPYVNRL